jgi:Short C-terminal domain
MSESRAHGKLVIAIIVVATLIGLVAVHAIWAKRQLLETDTWVETSSKLLEDADVRDALDSFIVDALFSNVDVQARLEKRLPPPAQALAGPAAAGLRELADRLTLRALESPKIQLLWESANRAAHETLITTVEGGGENVSTGGGDVTLNVGTIVGQIGDQLGINIADKLPESASTIEILRSDQLSAAQDGVRILNDLAYILPAIALLLYALAIYLARGWRRRAVRAVGWGFVVIGVVVLLIRSLAGNYLVASLASTAAVEPAANATWSIGTSLLKDGGIAMIGYGLVIVAGAWLAGPGSLARSVRREIAPILHDRRVGYAVLALIVVLVFWWNPTEGTSRLLPSLLLIVLLIVGFEAIRGQAVRDFPDETMERMGERWRRRLSGIHMPGRGRAPSADEQADERLAQLERLGSLRQSGVLDDEEFEREKQRIMTTA